MSSSLENAQELAQEPPQDASLGDPDKQPDAASCSVGDQDAAVLETTEVDPPEPSAQEPDAAPTGAAETQEVAASPIKSKPARPKPPKEHCPICLRWYGLAQVAPGMHKCVPPMPKSAVPEYDREGRPMSEPPKPPGPQAPVEPPKFEERQINYDDVMRFLTRERLSWHERKRERWSQQMFG